MMQSKNRAATAGLGSRIPLQNNGYDGNQNEGINFITDDFLQVLEEHRKVCEKEGKLNEAQAARKRLRDLKILNENRKREMLFNNHQNEMQALENAHMLEIKELLTKWNNIILPNFENEAALLELELKKRQETEVEMFRQQVEIEQKQQKFYFSTQCLDMKHKMEVLGNQGAYKDAKIIKKQLVQSQKEEKLKQTETSKSKLLMKSHLLMQQHSKEMNNLLRKHESNRRGLLLQKQKEFDVIEKRFVNVWNDLESKYKKELLNLDKLDTVKKMKIKEEKFQRKLVN